MAKTLEKFDFTESGAGAGRAKYDWDEWFDGQIWKLTKDEDWKSEASANVFAGQVRAAAKSKGYIVSVNTIGSEGKEHVIVQRTGIINDESKGEDTPEDETASDRVESLV